MKQLLPYLFLLLLPTFVEAQAVRRVMVESFTQASCGPCAAQNPAFNTLLQSNGGNVVLLKYQTSWPGFDPMNLQNPSEVATRVSYYGVTGVPNVRLDGAQNAGTSGSVTQAMLNTRLSQATPIDMVMDHQLSADLDSIYIQCKVKNLGTTEFNPGGVVLHTAIVEKQVLFPEPPGSTNEVDFKSVMRKMLPNAAGAALSAIPAGDSVTITYAVPLPTYIYNYAQIGVVAFVQKTSDRQVYQAVESFPKPLTGNLVDVGITPNSVGPDGLCTYNLTPQVDITNQGDNAITSMNVSYTINGGTPVVQMWTGNLASGATQIVTFPQINITPGATTVAYAVSNANGDAFDYNSLNELVTAESFFTLSENAVGSNITETIEAAPLRGIPANTLVIKDAENHFMAANRSLFNVTQEIGGYGTSTKSMFSNAYDWTDVGAEAHMIFEKIDLTGTANNYLRFDYAHAQYPFSSGNTNDGLRVSVSTDCGDSWTTVWFKAGAQLATRVPATTTSRFVPTATQWASDSISLTAYNGLDDINIRFTVVNDYGNSIFVDNIRVNQASLVGTDEPGQLSGKVVVYPNPASDMARIDVTLEEASPVQISVFDLSGKLIQHIAQGAQMPAGMHQFNWGPQAQGVYLVRVATSLGTLTERLTVVK
jgi:hypothetical protein